MANLNKRCRNCGDQDVTVQPREMTGSRVVVICAVCFCTLRQGSTVKQTQVPERVEQDRYAQMAAKYGL